MSAISNDADARMPAVSANHARGIFVVRNGAEGTIRIEEELRLGTVQSERIKKRSGNLCLITLLLRQGPHC